MPSRHLIESVDRALTSLDPRSRLTLLARSTFSSRVRRDALLASEELNRALSDKHILVVRAPVLVKIGRHGRGWIESLVVIEKDGRAWLYGSWSPVKPWAHAKKDARVASIYEQE